MKQHQRVVAPAQPAERTNQPSYRRYDLFRRVADLTVGLAGMVFAAPLMVAVAVAIKLDSRGPVFYKQERVGRNSRRQQHPRRHNATPGVRLG